MVTKMNQDKYYFTFSMLVLLEGILINTLHNEFLPWLSFIILVVWTMKYGTRNN